MSIVDFTPELISGIVAVAISWLYGWFPGLRTWYGGLKSEIKSLIMLGSLLLTSVVVYLLVYFGVIETSAPITLWRLLSVFFVSTTINQSTYQLTPHSKDAEKAKENRI